MLPQLTGVPFITDGGMETTLVYEQGLELPAFASFPLLETEDGRTALRGYLEPYLAIAREQEVGLLLDTPTWRANPDWGASLGYPLERLEQANRDAASFVGDTDAHLVSGCIGPRGDGYAPGKLMSADEAERYHTWQVEVFADTAVHLISALTMNYAEEAVGIARAVDRAGLPGVISFTVETDGRLPSGQPLREAVEQVDRETAGAPAYYMVNCAHPTHFAGALRDGGSWLERIGGLRANASKRSHAELDEADELDSGDPDELAADYLELRPLLPHVNVVGGCCGTDHRHVDAICRAWYGRHPS